MVPNHLQSKSFLSSRSSIFVFRTIYDFGNTGTMADAHNISASATVTTELWVQEVESNKVNPPALN
jgi:hypothetical protein